jgi:glucans biosynthesis protein C
VKERVHYVDALRVFAVLLLVPFHTARLFNGLPGPPLQPEPFYAKSAELSAPLSGLIGFIDVWHMPLLFLLAGASSYFALRKRDGRTYMNERATRLLVPLLFGVLVVVPPQAWIGAMTNTGYRGSLLAFWPSFYQLKGDLSGYFGTISPAHLWFILYLFVVSAAALPFMLRWRSHAEGGFASKAAARLAEPAFWLVPPLVLLFAEALPDIAGKNPFVYLGYFLLGYIAMADACFMEGAERRRVAALVLGIGGVVLTLATWPMAAATPDPSLIRAGHSVLRHASAWVTIVGLLGFGKRYLDRGSRLLDYASEASYPFYILHQTVIVVLGYYLLRLGLGVYPTWLLLMAATMVVTVALYEVLVRRTGVTRFFFGMRPKRRSAPEPVPETRAAG